MMQQSEAQFRNAIDASPVPYALNDEQQNITYLNPAFINTFGYDLSDIPVLADWWPKAYPDSEYRQWVARTWQQHLEKAKQDNTPFEPLEVVIHCKDGSCRTVLASAAPLTESFRGIHLVILYDITERKKIERSLVSSEERFRTLVENLPGVAYRCACDEHWTIEFISGEIQSLSGYPSSDFKNNHVRTYASIIHPDDVPHVERVVLEGVKQRKSFTIEYRILHANSDVRWVYEKGQGVFDSSGNLKWLDGVILDITERKKAEQSVREGDSYFRVLFEQSSFGVGKFDGETGRFVKVNYRYSEILGYSVEEMLELDFQSIILQEDLQDNLDNVKKLQNGELSSVQFEKRCNHKDGSVVWVNMSILPLWGSGSKPDFCLAIVKDISKRKKAEASLEFQKDEQQQIVNSMVDGVITIDESATVQSFNSSAEKIFGYSSAEVIGKNIKMLMPDAYANHHDEYLASYLSTAQPYVLGIPREVSGLRRNGEIFPMRLSVAELPSNIDGTRRFLGSCQDITLYKQQEEQLRRSQKMDALGNLTGGIAHDYNNVLGVILGYSQLLQAALADQPEMKKFADHITNASDRGRKLTSKLLAFTRKKEPEASPLNVNDVIFAQKELLEKTLTPRIPLVLELDQETWPVFLDSADLEDAILNLTINAMHAMDQGEGAQLTISSRNISISQRESLNSILKAGDYVLLSIADTGAGMDLETQRKIFDPFFTTKGDDGVGLGLSMVYAFIKRSSGDIEVMSSPGKGSRFDIYFPRYIEEKISVSDKVGETTGSFYGEESILIVDDEPALAEMLKESLSREGYKVVCANSAADAFEILKKQNINLLISDVLMPDMDGFQLVKEVEKLYPDIKFQIISGYADSRIYEADVEQMKQHLLYKPFPTEMLLKRIRDMFDREV